MIGKSRKPLRRKAPISRAPLTTGRRRKLRPVGDTKRKKRKRYDAFIASPEWQAIRRGAIRRAGYRCSYLTLARGKWVRCRATTELQVHHKTYARLGGEELPSDLIVYCKTHHALVEATQFPHRKHA